MELSKPWGSVLVGTPAKGLNSPSPILQLYKRHFQLYDVQDAMKNEVKDQFKDLRMLMEKQYDKLTDEIKETRQQVKDLRADTDKQYDRVTADIKATQEQVKGLDAKLTEVQVTQVRPLVNFTLRCPSVQPEFASGSKVQCLGVVCRADSLW